jgi:NADH-quinone oxidoreductase subunit G
VAGSHLRGCLRAARLSNRTQAPISAASANVSLPPVGIYQLDGIVRRAPSLQSTSDAREGVAA